jgi:hypothetical protein
MNSGGNVKKWGGAKSLAGMAATGRWPTPGTSWGSNARGSGARKVAIHNGTYITGKLNPELNEWLMGFPIGWTDLKE